MNLWQGLLPVEKRKLTIAEMAKHCPKSDIMSRHGWLCETRNGWLWKPLRTGGNCVSASQLASYYGVHWEWLKVQKI